MFEWLVYPEGLESDIRVQQRVCTYAEENTLLGLFGEA